MRLILALFALALPLVGCCAPTSEPILELKSPIWFQSRPVLAPQNYAIAAPAQAVYAPVPQVQAPAYQYAPIQQRAVVPCGEPVGQPYSPPPVPGDDGVPESIPAVRR